MSFIDRDCVRLLTLDTAQGRLSLAKAQDELESVGLVPSRRERASTRGGPAAVAGKRQWEGEEGEEGGESSSAEWPPSKVVMRRKPTPLSGYGA